MVSGKALAAGGDVRPAASALPLTTHSDCLDAAKGHPAREGKSSNRLGWIASTGGRTADKWSFGRVATVLDATSSSFAAPVAEDATGATQPRDDEATGDPKTSPVAHRMLFLRPSRATLSRGLRCQLPIDQGELSSSITSVAKLIMNCPSTAGSFLDLTRAFTSLMNACSLLMVGVVLWLRNC